MKAAFALCAMFIGLASGSAYAAMGAGHGPNSSWDKMQKFEYYLGDIAGALNLCGRDGLYRQMREMASLTPYGRKGMDAWLSYDSVKGCPRVSTAAKELLEDKDKILEYLKNKYDCSSGSCTER